MVTTFAFQTPVTPVGKPVIVAPVAPPDVEYVILVKAVFAQSVCALVPTAEVSTIVIGAGLTVIVPVAVTTPQPPIAVTVYGYVPVAVGVPLRVTTLPAHTPVTPEGNPVTLAPVAAVVAKVIFVKGLLTKTVWLLVPTPELRVMVFAVVTVIEPVLVTAPHPPVKVIV